MTATTIPTKLTDRYVHAVLRATPESKREGLERELRATIADAVEARIGQGEPPAAAERSALLELGDPARLAAGYADRPLQLIGPELYVDWKRLVVLLLAIVLPIVLVAYAFAQVLAGTAPGAIIGGAVATTLTVGLHIVFWVTLVFAVLERTGTRTPLVAFDPDQLPALPGPGSVKWSESIASAAFLVVFAAAIVGQQFWSIFEDGDGAPIPVLDPALWSFWLPYFLVLIGAEIAFAIALARVGRWTLGFAVVNVLLNLAFTVPAVWLAVTGRLFNEAYFAEFDGVPWIEAGSVTITVSVLAVAAVALWDCVDGFVKTARARGTEGAAA